MNYSRIYIGIRKVVMASLLMVVTMGCSGHSGESDSDTVVERLPDKVYRHWDENLDDAYYDLKDDQRFRVEYPDGKTLIFGLNEDGRSVTLYGGNPNGTELLVIPAEVELKGMRYPVTTIGRLSFATYGQDSIKWMAGVKEIVISEGIENLGPRCFEGAPDLLRISLPSSLTNIAYRSLADCSRLETVDIQKESKMLGIADNAFENCVSLLCFEIPAGVRRIRKGAWKNCKSLSSISIAEGNTFYQAEDGVLYTKAVRELVQYPAGKQTKEFAVASGITDIDDAAFYGNEYLEKVSFPPSLRVIGHRAFEECSRLKEMEFNVGLNWIGTAAFQGCKELKEVRLPGNTEYIQGHPYGDNSFPEWTKIRI